LDSLAAWISSVLVVQAARFSIPGAQLRYLACFQRALNVAPGIIVIDPPLSPARNSKCV
jgi:hypothetical protein